MVLKELEGLFRGMGDVDFAVTISHLKQDYEERHGLDDITLQETHLAKEPISEQELKAEWERIAQRYVEHGFHTELGLSAEDYVASLPKFESQPEEFTGRFDTPVLVERRISPRTQIKLAGFDYHLDHEEGDQVNPNGPYTVWMQTGENNLGRSAKNVLDNLDQDEYGATLSEGVSILLSNPDLLNRITIALPGTPDENGVIPLLHRWSPNRLGVGCDKVVFSDSSTGTATCGIKKS